MKNKPGLIFIILVVSFNLSYAQQMKAPLPAPPAVKAPLQNKISLDIKGMDVVDVLKMIASRSGMNIAVGKNVSGKVTLFLKDVDIWDAFEIVLATTDLAYEKRGDIISVISQRDYELQHGQRHEDKKEAKIIQLKFSKAVDLSKALNQIKTNIGRIVTDEGTNTVVLIDTPEKIVEMADFINKTDLPLETRIFSLNYAQAEKVSPKIQESITKGVGSIKIDERTNRIVVTDYPRKLEDLQKVITAFDEKTLQVLIDAQIIEIKPSDKFTAGVDWEYWIEKNIRLASVLPSTSILNKISIGMAAKGGDIGEQGQYKTVIDLLRTIGDTKILSSPRIMALNNQEAKILVGTKEAYVTSSQSQGSTGTTVTSQTVNYVDVGIKLYVTPTINKDGFVTMKIKPEVSSAEYKSLTSEGQSTEVPIVTTSESETTVMVKDGVTLIIGGLKKDKKDETVNKVPLIGDIPFLGKLFSNTSREFTTSELVILLTPHIISGEVSLTSFSEIPPKQGAVVSMKKGEIAIDKIPQVKVEEKKKVIKEVVPVNVLSKVQGKVESKAEGNVANVPMAMPQIPVENKPNYYQLITERIKNFAQNNKPKDLSGEVALSFKVNADGQLMEEPKVISASDTSLIPYAMQCIKGASPFPAFYAENKNKEELFAITVEYK